MGKKIDLDKIKASAKEKYDDAVKENIKAIKKGNTPELDPDKYSQYVCKLSSGLDVNMSQDGLCGYKEIEKYSKDIKKDYKKIREGGFDCLVWPSYAMSINQMRYSKFKDRIDLLLIDIKNLYKIINS